MKKSLVNAIFKTILPHIFLIAIFFTLILPDLTVALVIFSLGFCLFFLTTENSNCKIISLILTYLAFISAILIKTNPIKIYLFYIPNTFAFSKTYIPVLLKYYGIAVLLAFLSQTTYYIVLYTRNVILIKPREIYNELVYPPSRKNFVVLSIFLLVEATYEEVIFRAIPFWIGSYFLPNFILIIISSIIFGLFHYRNAGWFGVIDSGMAGVIFAMCFVKLGLFSSIVIHVAWNSIQMVELYVANIRMEMTHNEL